jgi:hypothetical protein
MTTPLGSHDTLLEEWKEVNTSIRHWELLLFGTAKDYLSIVAFAVGAAGAALAWPGIPWELRRYAIMVFLLGAICLAVCAIVAVWSQKNYLRRFYGRRDTFPQFRPRKSKAASSAVRRSRWWKTGWSIRSLYLVFVFVIAGATALIIVLPERLQPTLRGARLYGSDLSMVVGLVQSDFEGACADSTSKLPAGVTLPPCR